MKCLTELSLFKTSKIINNNFENIVNEDEFINKLQPGDIILSKVIKKENMNFIVGKLTLYITQLVQRASITSSKTYMGDGIISGYGVDPYIPYSVKEYKIDDWIKYQKRALILRPNINQQKMLKTIKFIHKKINLDYDNSILFKSVWNRFLNKTHIDNEDIHDLTSKELDELRIPLICSSLIHLSFLYAGNPIKYFYKVHPLEVWPRDFLYTHTLEPIVKFER